MPGRFPTVIVQHEVFGLDDDNPAAGPYIRAVVHRFVRLGYVGLAANAYSREGRVPGDTSDQVGRYRILMNLSDEPVLQDLEAGFDYVAGQDFVDPHFLGLIGFCQGGFYAFLMAAHSSRLKAAVDFYGQIIYCGLNENKPVHTISFVPQIACPLLGLYGDHDPMILAGHRERLVKAVKDADKEDLVEIVVYPEASHGFFRDPDPAA